MSEDQSIEIVVSDDPPPPPTRWAQFGLRRLLVGFIALSLLMAFVVAPYVQRTLAKRQETAALGALNALEKNGTYERRDGWVVKFTLSTYESPDAETRRKILEQLAQLPKLETLDLSSSRFGDREFALLGELKALKSLNLSNTSFGNKPLGELPRLRFLEKLDLSGTQVTDVGLDHIAAMPALRVLKLESYGRHGARSRPHITDVGIAKLRNMEQLTELNISSTLLTDRAIDSLSKLTNLTEVDVSHSYLSPNGLQRLSTSLPDCKIIDEETSVPMILWGTGARELPRAPESHPDEQKAVSQLAELGAVFVLADGKWILEPGTPKTKVRNVIFAYPHVTEIIDDAALLLPQLTKLEQLSLGRSAVSDVGLASICKCQELVSLNLSDSKLTPKGLSLLTSLSKLRSLSLANTETDDASAAILAELSKVKTLNLEKTNVTDAGLKSLMKLQDLEELRLNSTVVTLEAVPELSQLQQLKSLNLDATKVSDAGLVEVGKLPSLEQLSLNFTQIGDEGVAQLATLTELRTLGLMSKKITSTGVSSFASLRKLEFLNLQSTSVDDACLPTFEQLPNLRTLVLRGTKVSPQGIRQLEAALPNTKIHHR